MEYNEKFEKKNSKASVIFAEYLGVEIAGKAVFSCDRSARIPAPFHACSFFFGIIETLPRPQRPFGVVKIVQAYLRRPVCIPETSWTPVATRRAHWMEDLCRV